MMFCPMPQELLKFALPLKHELHSSRPLGPPVLLVLLLAVGVRAVPHEGALLLAQALDLLLRARCRSGCSCDGRAGGLSVCDATLLAVDSVRVPTLECGTSPTPLPQTYHHLPASPCTCACQLLVNNESLWLNMPAPGLPIRMIFQ